MIVNTFSTLSAGEPLSVARTRIEKLAFVSKSKLAAVVSLLPLIANEPLSIEPTPATSAKVKVSPASGSVADNVPTVVPAGCFSATTNADSSIPVGPEFGAAAFPVPGPAADGVPDGAAR